MNKATILSELQTIFRSIFKDEGLIIALETTQGDIDQWDSLHHTVLINQIEKQFEIKFNLMDMLGMQTVGQICDKILTKKENQ